MKNFLFVVPRFAPHGQYYWFPYGLAYVVSYIKTQGFNVFTINLCHHNESIESVLRDRIEKRNIDIICTGGMSTHWDFINDIVSISKKIKPNITTVVGGAIITSDPKLALENMPIDYGIIGEGEETMAELANTLCNGKDVYNVRGIAFFDENKNLVITDPRPPIEDLDSLPFPDYEGLEYSTWLKLKQGDQDFVYPMMQELKNNLAEISASRSCPYQCTFCYHPLGHVYRQRSLDNVFKEIEYLKEKYNITIITILDELFSKNEKRITEFTERIKKYDIRWNAQWRVDNVNEEMLLKLKKSGILTLGLGVESLSDIVLASMKKRTTKKDIEKAYSLCNKVGIRVSSNIIIGDLEETEETIKESLDWLKQHPEHDLNVDFLLAVPDSAVWRNAVSRGLITNKIQFIKQGFPVINLTKIPEDKFNKIKKNVEYYKISQCFVIFGEIISSHKEGRKFFWKIRCPVCNEIEDYVFNKNTLSPYAIIICKNCLKRMKIRTTPLIIYYGILFYWKYLKNYPLFKYLEKRFKQYL